MPLIVSDHEVGLHSEAAVNHFRLFHDSSPGIVRLDSRPNRAKAVTLNRTDVASDESDEDERMARVKSVVLDRPLKPLRPRDARTIGRLI